MWCLGAGRALRSFAGRAVGLGAVTKAQNQGEGAAPGGAADRVDRPARRRLSEDEENLYTALDPAAATSDKPWEFECRSPFMRRLAVAAVVVVMAIHIFMAAVVGVGDTGAAVTTVDKLAFVGIGTIIAVALGVMLWRPRVRANADGVEVRNVIGTRFYPWAVIYGLSFPRGARTARLELPEFEFVPMLAMQAADKSQILGTVDRFRELEAKYLPEDD